MCSLLTQQVATLAASAIGESVVREFVLRVMLATAGSAISFTTILTMSLSTRSWYWNRPSRCGLSWSAAAESLLMWRLIFFVFNRAMMHKWKP